MLIFNFIFYITMHIFKTILFDLDGTLLDTLEDLGTSLNHVLEHEGYPTHAMDTYRQFVGEGAEKLVLRALPANKRNEHNLKHCLQAFKKEYANHWNIKTKPYGGIKELLDELTNRRIKLTVLSNKPHEYTVKCVSELLQNWTFDVVLGQRHNVPRKPDPAGAAKLPQYSMFYRRNVFSLVIPELTCKQLSEQEWFQ